ncbi:MAG: NADH-quinone oxidoreductase subunit C [Candidatus Uhrbacteria bacterium]|nr:NADH-quinone oxidoreductase subunit C [Candidatus Uhrbacteria bacterium]
MNAQEILHTIKLSGHTHGSLVTLESVSPEWFTPLCNRLSAEFKLPLSLLYATDDRKEGKGFGIHVLFALDASHEWLLVETTLSEENPSYESLTKTIMEAHWYERYAMDMFGIKAEGHPDPRRLVHHENVPANTHPLRKDFAWNTKMEHANEPYPMHHIEGEGIFEIPVGPIHAGVIEPGHFRFNVAGERIITLEGKLFFTHKGVEKLLEGKTVAQALPFIERISGDMSASHTLAFAQAIEQISSVTVPKRAQELRVLITELERITMHTFDIGNMAGNGTGFTVEAAHGFRVKEKIMRLSERVFGNRFWRGFVVPGGVSKTLSQEELLDIVKTTKEVVQEMEDLFQLGRHSDGLRERLETTGVLAKEVAVAFGALGLPARGSGVDRDVRRDHPYAAYAEMQPEVFTFEKGDVYARWKLRALEMVESMKLIEKICASKNDGSVRVDVHVKDGMAIGAVESWRGELLNVVYVRNGVIARCVPRDPSFCNWALFGAIGPGNIIPDFPLCNKSLNLSYSGTDL